MKLIRQEDEYGCGIACFGMVIGKGYKAAKRYLGVGKDIRIEGLRIDRLVTGLYEFGYYTNQERYHDKEWLYFKMGRKKKLNKTGLGILIIGMGEEMEHVVVWDGKKVYDPARAEAKEIRWYEERLMGVIRIC
jgi:hypothetical protein